METSVKRVGRPCAEVRTSSLSIRLPEVAIGRLAELAAKRGVTTNHMARILILRGLNQDYNFTNMLKAEEE